MRNPLNKRFPKEFRANAPRYICILLLLVTVILVGSSFSVVMDGAADTLKHVEETHKVEDGYVETVDPISDDLKSQLEDEGIILYENFYIADNEFGETAKVFVFDQRDEINLPSVHQGRLPDEGAANEVAIDRIFAGNNDIDIGDTININGSDVTVVGYIALPDYNSLFFNNADMMMNTHDFGVLVASHATYDGLNHALEKYRYSYRFIDRNLSDDDKAETAKTIMTTIYSNGAAVQNLLPADKNQSINYLKEDMGKDGPMVKVFVYVLIVIIAFIFAVLTSNTIEQEAPIIGTLRALGYKKSEIIFHYLFPTIIIGILGSIIGNAIGYTLMIEPFKNMYYTTYSLPPLEVKFNAASFVLTTVLPVVLMIVVNFIMLASKLSLSPLKFLRKDLKKQQKKVIKLPNVSFITRFRMRVILQNKSSYIILFLGIFLSSFLLLFGLGIGPLMNIYVDRIDDNLTYEYLYILKSPVEADGEKIYMYSLDTNYYFTNSDIGVSFYGVDDDTSFFATAGVPEAEGEVAITDSFAKKCRIGVGDVVTFRDPTTDAEYELRVGAVNDYTDGLGVYMNRESLLEMLGEDEIDFNAYVSNEKLAIDDMYIAKFMTRADMIGAVDQMLSSFDVVIGVVSGFAVVTYMIFMYLLTKIVIEKNALYISFMKVFGYEKNEIRKLYLDASAVVVIVSLFVCLPLEAWLLKFALVYISSMIEGYMEYIMPMYVYVEIVVIGLIAYFAINFLHLRKVGKIPMSEALKNRD